MRARASFETLPPGVNVRETAERDTPARSATSAAVTNEPRARSCFIPLRTPVLHTCATSLLVLHARARYGRNRLLPCHGPTRMGGRGRRPGDGQHPVAVRLGHA